MKSFLDKREVVLETLYKEIFKQYPKEVLEEVALQLLKDVSKREDISKETVKQSFANILNKTETFNILLTLYELELRLTHDEALVRSMNDISYNQHRAIALNICDMYSAGASSLFGYLDCTFSTYFPEKDGKGFLAKGISALIASAVETSTTKHITEDYTQKNLDLLKSRGVSLEDMSCLVLDLQKPYNPTLTLKECEEHILGVLRKQQTYHTIEICVLIDKGVEQNEFGPQFQAIVGNDEGLYGVDESVNTAISKLYGEIAITNFGHLDKTKPGIIGALDSDHEDNHCNTFLDDTVCAIVSAACARLAHNSAQTISKPVTDN